VAYLVMEQISATAPLAKKIGPYYSGIATYALVALAMIVGSLLKPASAQPTIEPNP
jgi:SSS family solute:Na+ symporter